MRRWKEPGGRLERLIRRAPRSGGVAVARRPPVQQQRQAPHPRGGDRCTQPGRSARCCAAKASTPRIVHWRRQRPPRTRPAGATKTRAQVDPALAETRRIETLTARTSACAANWPRLSSSSTSKKKWRPCWACRWRTRPATPPDGGRQRPRPQVGWAVLRGHAHSRGSVYREDAAAPPAGAAGIRANGVASASIRPMPDPNAGQ